MAAPYAWKVRCLEPGRTNPVGVVGDGSTCTLFGTLNVQGRYNNGSPAPCTTAAPGISGTFIHIEQRRSVRTNFNEYVKLINAVADAVQIEQSDLMMTRICPAIVTAGGPISYTIMVTNQGPNDALAVDITHMLPTEVIPSGATMFAIPVLPAGANTTLVVNGTVSPAAMGVITNQANVTTVTADPNTTNNSITCMTTVNGEADLAIGKMCPATAVAGLVNQADVISATSDPNSTNNSVTCMTTVNGEADLAVRKICPALSRGRRPAKLHDYRHKPGPERFFECHGCRYVAYGAGRLAVP